MEVHGGSNLIFCHVEFSSITGRCHLLKGVRLSVPVFKPLPPTSCRITANLLQAGMPLAVKPNDL
jgi:hypothetical protein